MSGESLARTEWVVRPPVRLCVWLIGWWCLVLGCVPPKVQIQTAPQFDPSRISSVAILPFQAIQTPQRKNSFQRGCVRELDEFRTQFQLPGTDGQVDVRESGREMYVVSEKDAQRITAKVTSALIDRPSLRVIGPLESVAGIDMKNQEDRLSLQSVAQEVGTRLNVDGVLTGLVRTYRDREGSRFGAKPAAVGFEIYLLKSSDGTLLWTGKFFEEQKPFNQDVVGFFEKGGGFITADELAELGVQKVMEAFPVGREVVASPLPAHP